MANYEITFKSKDASPIKIKTVESLDLKEGAVIFTKYQEIHPEAIIPLDSILMIEREDWRIYYYIV